jgi:hypothetical protein
MPLRGYYEQMSKEEVGSMYLVNSELLKNPELRNDNVDD